MNANELADEFNADNIFWNEDNLRHWGTQAATMLRQQQAEIEALKEKLKWLEGKCLMVQELDDSHYPFRAILRKAQEK